MAIKLPLAQSAVPKSNSWGGQMIRHAIGLAALGLLISTSAAMSEDVPDARAVEWQGQHPCEKLYEDAEIRALRCTFPPDAVHVRHSHPGNLVYTISGGKIKGQDDKGTFEGEPKTGGFRNNPPTPWHEITNVGDTTLSYLVIEKKYEPVATK
jgi:quercetin dioxygenase-like cupin family protein